MKNSCQKCRHLIMFLIADSSKLDLVGGFNTKSSSTAVSTPAFLRKIALWIANKPSSTTSSRGAGGGCKPQYRFLGTWKGGFKIMTACKCQAYKSRYKDQKNSIFFFPAPFVDLRQSNIFTTTSHHTRHVN